MKRLGLLATALLGIALMAAVDTPRFGRFARSATAGAFDAGSMPVVGDAGTPYQYAFFEFAPSTGLGMPTECGDGGVYAVLDGGQALAAIAFARASAAECYSNDGQTLTQLPAGQPRVSSGRIDSSVLGVYSDPTRSNYMTYTRDCSNAAWAKTNTTCTKTATGMRGDANGASLLTATSDNGYVCQATGAPSDQYTGSLHAKRVTGTGAINVSMNGGSNWYSVTSRVSATLWRRVVNVETAGCIGGNCILVPNMFINAANPTICVQLGTTGDQVALDFAQIEQAVAPSSPIACTATNVTRAADIVQYDLGAGSPIVDGYASFAWSLVGASNAYYPGYIYASPVSFVDTSANGAAWIFDSNISSMTNGAGYLECSYYNTVPAKAYSSYAPVARTGRNSCRYYGNGTAPVGSAGLATSKPMANLAGTHPALRYLQIGGNSAQATQSVGGVINRVCASQLDAGCGNSDAVAQTATDVVWVGDSIVAGGFSYPATPPELLHSRLYPRVVHNVGVGGDTVAQCGARWTALRSTPASTVVWSCGINDIIAGTAGATTATAAQVFLADMRSLGKKVVITSIMPWGSALGWTAPKETERQAYNSAQSTWAGANGAAYVSTDSLGTGSPLALTAANSSGDGLHPSPVGSLGLVDLVVDGGAP
jgi:hypothetical protein